MKKALFLLLLYLLPFVLIVFGDPLIAGFLIRLYAPIGALYAIFIWIRPLQEMMVYVAFTPLLLVLTIWAMVIVSYFFEGIWFASTGLGLAFGVSASIFTVAIGFIHVLICHGIYILFRDEGWFESD